ncbi:DoxX family membrane protein [Nonomuraea sp. MCN248]|uniref:DoxX family membrane protein n=1 Tax=Nonomuraea corallina TaxID=2989783 RepID=A0ABT4SGD3_9ACTN|nr:DoxX family membrane protein [Nonomuraea corallina]MDA0636190.1 DoxX family membrane protein [Nonomuraea corallina]
MRQSLRDLAALVARLGVGGIFFANGWRKLEIGLVETGAQFQAQGAPAPRAWATATMLVELIGGTLLIAGLMVPVIGLVLFAEAVAVLWVAPPLNPITLNELILLGAASLLLAVVGAGRISVDHMVVIRRRESAAADEFAADNEADAVIAALRDPDRPTGPTGPAAQSKPAADPTVTLEKPTTPDKPVPPEKESPGEPARSRTEKGQETGPGPEDTAPHPRPRPARAVEPSPATGDTLVAGRKKPAPRSRRPADD